MTEVDIKSAMAGMQEATAIAVKTQQEDDPTVRRMKDVGPPPGATGATSRGDPGASSKPPGEQPEGAPTPTGDSAPMTIEAIDLTNVAGVPQEDLKDLTGEEEDILRDIAGQMAREKKDNER